MCDQHTITVRTESDDIFTYRAARVSIMHRSGKTSLDLTFRISPTEVSWQRVDGIKQIVSFESENLDLRRKERKEKP